MRGLIKNGINNIYTVETTTGCFECRIKGKVLTSVKNEYNPLCCGDFVEIEQDQNQQGKAMILSRYDRKNSFSRWNKKRGNIQTIAANIDILVCILSSKSPPFRPRFADRVIVNAEDNIPVLIVMNKIDQGLDDDLLKCFNCWTSLKYLTLMVSAKEKKGIKQLKELIFNKTAAFVGQSGVGKSSLLNEIDPAFQYKVGSVSKKFNKGTHTTSFAVLDHWNNGIIIDTPGIKEIDPVGIEPEVLSHFMRDFKPFIGLCSHSVCLHRDEPGCAVKEAVKAGNILEERYDSYLRMLSDLEYRISTNRYRG